MLKLIMLKGLPGCGKTTFAKELQKKDPKIVRVNKDDLRSMLHAGVWSKKNEKQVLYMRDEIVCHSLSHGRSVIVDDTNFSPRHEKDLRKFAEFNKAEFEIKDFTDVKPEVCIKRDLKRPNSVGQKVILRMYHQFLRKDSNEKQPLNPLIHGDNLPRCVIFDLDGTLAHIHDRSPYDGKSCGSDLVNKSVKFLLQSIESENYWIGEECGDPKVSPIKRIILSGRNGESKPETIKWLKDNEIKYDELHMRAPGDMRKDSIIKKEIFDEHIKDKYNVLFVVDDRDQMVELWRSMGLTCLQCNYGNF